METAKLSIEMDPYPGKVIEKEECINHADKRMGTALLKKSKEARLGGKGKGKLTEKMAKYLQHCYRFAVLNHIPDTDNMRRAVFATVFHVSSTDDVADHSRCPQGLESWC